MAIGTIDTTHNEFDLANKIDQSKGKVQKAIGELRNSASNAGLAGGIKDFAGMDKDKVPEFRSLVSQYIGNVNEIIAGLKTKVNLDDAIKGSVQTQMTEFFDSIKEILETYTKTLEYEAKEVEEAQGRWEAAISALGTRLGADATSVKGAAKQLPQID